MDSVYLRGSEDVRNAAASMREAADKMMQAAMQIDWSLTQHANRMEELVRRFEAATEHLARPAEEEKCHG